MSINFSGGHVHQYGDVGSCGQYWQNVESIDQTTHDIKIQLVDQFN